MAWTASSSPPSRQQKPSIGPRRRPANRLNGPTGKEPQTPSAWAIAVGLSNLTLRGTGDPFFIRIQDQQPGPVYRIYHDSVHDENYDREQASVRVLDSYEKLLMYLEES
jgi:hypothetical protein